MVAYIFSSAPGVRWLASSWLPKFSAHHVKDKEGVRLMDMSSARTDVCVCVCVCVFVSVCVCLGVCACIPEYVPLWAYGGGREVCA
jgi:hypothetical protein